MHTHTHTCSYTNCLCLSTHVLAHDGNAPIQAKCPWESVVVLFQWPNGKSAFALSSCTLTNSPIHQTADKLRVKIKSDELPNKDVSDSKLFKLVQISWYCCRKVTANGLCVEYCCCVCFQLNALIACE